MRYLSVLAIAFVACQPAEEAGSQEELPTVVENQSSADSMLEELPTPYSAAQIRDAWVKGLWLDTETTTQNGREVRRTRVVGHTEESVTLTDQALDAEGLPVGEALEIVASWNELRLHALFPAERAARQRVERTTALGTFKGWLYSVQGAQAGSVDELFFADALPGAPILFQSLVDGVEVLRAEQILRGQE